MWNCVEGATIDVCANASKSEQERRASYHLKFDRDIRPDASGLLSIWYKVEPSPRTRTVSNLHIFDMITTYPKLCLPGFSS